MPLTAERFLRVVFFFAASAPLATADGITLAQLFATQIDGTDVSSNHSGAAQGSASNANSGSAVTGAYTQNWSVSAFAQAGLLKAYASENVTCSPCGPQQILSNQVGLAGDALVGAEAWWDEVLTVVPGTHFASLNFVFTISGNTTRSSSSGVADAGVIAETCAFGSGFCHAGVSRTLQFAQLAPNQMGTTIINLTPWALNKPINIEYILNTAVDAPESYNSTFTNAYLNGPSSETVNFSDTMSLVAIQAVDAAGNVIHDGTEVFDDSGNALPGTIPAPVPEPASYFLVVVSLAFLFALFKKKAES